MVSYKFQRKTKKQTQIHIYILHILADVFYFRSVTYIYLYAVRWLAISCPHSTLYGGPTRVIAINNK